MFNQKLKAQLRACQTRLDEEQGIIEAIKAGAATVIFSPEGSSRRRPLSLALMGYGAAELIGQPHSQRQLCPGLGSPVTIASSGGVSLREVQSGTFGA